MVKKDLIFENRGHFDLIFQQLLSRQQNKVKELRLELLSLKFLVNVNIFLEFPYEFSHYIKHYIPCAFVIYSKTYSKYVSH